MADRSCVIFNPAAGRGKARRRIEAAMHRLGSHVQLIPTERPNHAIELAERAAHDGFTRIIAAGGDGTVHEVANGLLRSSQSSFRFSTLPLGSMNDYAFALGLSRWWMQPESAPPLQTVSVDVGVIRADGRERYFVNGIGVGFNGMVTIESRRIRWLRGLPLYTLAFLRAGIKHFAQLDLDITFDEKTARFPTLALSVNLGQREGGFPVTPRARLDDGVFDLLHATGLRRWQLLRYFPALMTGNLPQNHPKLRTGTCQRVRVQSAQALCVHADGELFCVPEDGVNQIEVEILSRKLPVETCPDWLPN